MRAVVFVVALSTACAGARTQKEPLSWQSRVGEQVELRGTAHNAKAGAVVVVDGEPIYLRDVAAWPDEQLGKSVTVSGRLRSLQLIPPAVRDADGAISQGGGDDEQWVLEEPRY